MIKMALPKWKRYLSFCLSVFFCLSMLLPAFKQAMPVYGEYLQYENLTYIINDDDTITITNYNWGSKNYVDEVVIPEEIDGKPVIEIGYWAFYHESFSSKRYTIDHIILPEGLKIIGEYAFYCVETTIEMPATVTSIGSCAFCKHGDAWDSFNVTVDYKGDISDWLQITKGSSWAGGERPYGVGEMGPDSLLQLHIGGSKLSHVEIPDGTTEIKENSFSYCDIDSIYIPESVTNIGYDVVGPGPVTVQYAGTVSDWMNIEKNSWSLGYRSISKIDRGYCRTSPVKPFVTLLFEKSSVLFPKNLRIPDGTTVIGSYDFYNCIFSSVSIPASVKRIGSHAFGSEGMEVNYQGSLNDFLQIDMDGALNKQQSGVFGEDDGDHEFVASYKLFIDGEPVDNIVIPKGTESIKSYAFAGCSNIKSITLPLTVTTVEKAAFAKCTSLTSFVVHNADCEMHYRSVDNEWNFHSSKARYSGVIYGWEDSKAKAYADENKFTFEPIESSPEGMRTLGSNPFAILLTGDTVVVKNQDGSYPTIQLTAHMKPWGNEPVKNASLSIELPDHMTVDETSCKKEVIYDTIQPDETIEYTWTIQVDNEITYNCDHPILVKYCAENKTPKRTKFSVIVQDEAVDNRIEWKKDNFSFTNNADSFLDYLSALKNRWGLSSTVWMDCSEVVRNLCEGYSNRVYSILKIQADGGSPACYGMSSAVALKKAGYDGSLLLNYIDDGILNSKESILYNVSKPKDEVEVGEYIYFHFFQQHLPDIEEIKFNQKILDDDSIMIRQLVEATKKVKIGGVPVVIGMTNHAIVAYDVTEGTYNKDGNEYRYQLSIYNPNSLSEEYAYVTEDFSQFYFKKVERCLALSTVNQICQETSYGDSRSLYKDYSYDLIHVYYKEEAPAAYDLLTTDETVIEEVGYSEEEDESGTGIIHHSYVSPDLSNGFSISSTSENAELSVSTTFSDYVMHAASDDCNSITFNKDGVVSLQNDSEAHYTIELSMENTFGNMPWFTVSASGSDAKEISLKQSEEGVLLTSDNLSTCNVFANNRTEESSLTLHSDETTVEIRLDSQKLAVYADLDQDGVFEEMIANSEDNPLEIEPESPLLGDVNFDSSVNASDAALILIAAASYGAGNGYGLTTEQERAAEVNSDDTINASDAALVLIYAAAAGAGQDVGTLEEYLKR